MQETSDELFSSWHGTSVRISQIAVDCFLNKIEVLVFQVAPRRIDKRHLDFRVCSKLGRRFSRRNSDVSDELPNHVPNSDERLGIHALHGRLAEFDKRLRFDSLKIFNLKMLISKQFLTLLIKKITKRAQKTENIIL